MKRFLLLTIFGIGMGLMGWGQTTVFTDDFSTNTNATYTTSGAIGASSWSVNRSGADFGARRNTSPEQLELTNDVGGTANANGWIFAYASTSSFSSPYNTTLSSNTGLVTWTFNMRQIRTDPAGFADGNYGVAFIIGGTSTTVPTAGNGYAILLGQSGTTDPIRLAKYTTGLRGTLSNIITSNTTGLTDFGAEYLSIKVTYNPSNNQWELFLRNDGASAFTDPTTGSLTSQGTATDNTYTGTALSYLGGYWSAATGATQTSFFDNVKVTVTPSTSAPSVTTQAVSSIGATSATFNGNITSDGGSSITDRGFCYKTSAGVTIDDNKTSEGGTAVGTYWKSFTLSSGTQYFYKAYATNGVGTTLSSTEISFYTYSTEPTNHPSSFTATANSQTSITTNWDDNDPEPPGQNASGYLIFASTTNSFTDPVDGAAQTDDNNLADGSGKMNISHGVQTYAWTTGLSAGTLYYFKIFAYNGSGTSINYLTDPTGPTASATTAAALDATSEVDGPVLGSQPNPTFISSLVDTDGEALRVFDMDVWDYSDTDTEPTKITQLTIKAGTNNTATWSSVIQGVKLSINGGTSFVTTGTPTIGASSIVIPVTSGNLNVPDNDAITVSMFIYLNTSGLTDNQILEFKVDATAASHGFIADATGSTFLTTFATAPVSNEILIDVDATKLLFTTAPSATACPNTNLSTPPVVTAKDANNNTDLDFTGQVTLTNSGSLVMTGYQVNPSVAGVANFANLQFTTTGNVTLSTTNTSGLTNDGPTSSIAISVSNVTATGATNGDAQSVVTWTNPSCYDEIMIVAKAGSAVTATPTGDGSAYAGDLAFGSGTTFDGGYVVYEGSASPKTVTNLTNGTTYYFTFFTRKATSWSTGVTSSAAPAINTDYFRSKATGNWNVNGTWQSSADGVTNWADATFTPGATNTVYIQSGHTVTLTQNEACKDLHIAKGNASGNSVLGKIAIETFTLSVNGKLRNYYAAVGTVPGTNYDTYASYPFTGTSGKVSIVGDTRNLTNTGEWGATVSTPSTGIFPLEINLNTGQTITIQAVIKASSWNLASGTLDVGTNRLAVDNGTEGQGNVTIASGATLISSVTGTGTASLMSRTGNASTGEGGTFLLNGTLILSGASPEIAMTTVTLNGTVEYNAASTQNLLKATVTGAVIPNVYTDLLLNGSGTKSLGFNTAVNGSLIVNSPSVFDASTFVINGSGSFDLQSGATFKTAHSSGLNGSITVSGTKTLSTGANYEFSGTGAQVTGALLPATVNNLTASGTSQLTISNAGLLTVAGNLNIGSGTKITIGSAQSLTVTGTLTNSATATGLVIESDATGTGSLKNNTDNVPATVKQYMTNVTTWLSSVDGWHFLSSPVANQGISGSFTPGGSNYDFFKFDESSYTWFNQKVPGNNITTFGGGTGYLVAYEALDTKSFVGNLNNGDVPITLTRTTSLPDTQEGWNLIGNPFCSSIDWDDVNPGTVAADAFYIRNAANNGWGTYVDGVASNYNTDGVIPPMQGFFVRATVTPGILTIPFTARVHGTQDFTKGTAEMPVNVIKLKTNGNDQSDELVIRFKNEATTQFDDNSDAYKFISDNGAIPQIYSVLNDVFYSINSLPVPTEEVVIPVYIRVGQISTIELLQQDNTLEQEITYWVEDVKTGQKFDLTEGSYSFTSLPNDDYLRFRVHFLKSTGIETTEPLSGLNIYSYGNSLYFNTTLNLDATISIFNITGQEVYSTRTRLDGMKQIGLNVPIGWYVVKVMCDEGIKSEKIFIR